MQLARLPIYFCKASFPSGFTHGHKNHVRGEYQLRNLSNFSVLFSWGSEEAWRARLSDALDAARDSMSLTRRTREQQTEQASSAARRKAV